MLEPADGRVSEASLCAVAAIDPHRAGVSIFGRRGELALDGVSAIGPEAFAVMRREFAEAVANGTSHPLDVLRGLHLQRIIDSAETQLNARPTTAQATI